MTTLSPWAAGVVRSVPINPPRTVMVSLREPFTDFVGYAVEEFYLGSLRTSVKVVYADGSFMRVHPCFLCEGADLANVVILRPRERR